MPTPKPEVLDQAPVKSRCMTCNHASGQVAAWVDATLKLTRNAKKPRPTMKLLFERIIELFPEYPGVTCKTLDNHLQTHSSEWSHEGW